MHTIVGGICIRTSPPIPAIITPSSITRLSVRSPWDDAAAVLPQLAA